MGDDSGFKHITIGAADAPDEGGATEEEDIVIVAGRPESEIPETMFPREEDAPAVGEPSASRQPTDAPDGYHPTTMDDIQGSKMPATQIVVISVALICLAAFIIWYIVLS